MGEKMIHKKMMVSKGAERRPLKPGQRIKFEGPVSGAEFFAGAPQEARVICIYYTNARWPVETLKVALKDMDTAYEGTIARRQVTHVLVPRQPKEKEKGEPRVERYASRFSLELNGDGRDGLPVSLFTSRPVACRELTLSFGNIVRLVELREGEAIVSRKQLAEAWDKSDGTLFGSTSEKSGFAEFCASLGITKEKV
jgi:hypothetical protein